jgi:spermidine synthase
MIHRKHVPLALWAALALCVFAGAEEKILYEQKSPFGIVVVTEDEQGLRTLLFEKGGVRQSVVKVGDPDHLELAYARVMPVGLVFVEEPRRVLIVGLGGGTVPGFLHKHYPKMRIDVVEIDPDVVAVAKKFFGFREDDTLRAYVKDGRKFIEECRDPYDVIFLDAFGPDNIPYSLTTREFLQAVRRALTPKGIVVANIWNRDSNSLYDSMVRTYQEVFADLHIVEVRGAGNEIVVALPREKRIERDDLAQRAARISKEKQFRFDLGDLVTQGYRHEAENNSRGSVLTDKNKPEKAG